MSEILNEIDALKQIDSLVGNLSDEERIRIFDFLLAKYKMQISKKQIASNPSSSNSNEVEIPLDVSIKEFVSLKRPEGFYERIACLAYYLEKIRGMDGFKTSDITEANKEARQSPMSNPTFFVNDATRKYGYLMPIGSGQKVLSAKGEAIVHALPDREKVKQILEMHPTKRKVKRPIIKVNDENVDVR